MTNNADTHFPHAKDCHCIDCHDCDECASSRCDCECDDCYYQRDSCDCSSDCGFCAFDDISDYCGCNTCTLDKLDEGAVDEDEIPWPTGTWFESAYAEPRWLLNRRVTRSPRSMYDDCSAEELRSFVRARYLKDPFPEGLTFRYYYIRTLESADRFLDIFRFMDLPSAIRTMVYKELLDVSEAGGIGNNGSNIHATILRSCRQVYQEAIDILYSNSTVACLLHFSQSPLSGGLLSAIVEVKQHAYAGSSRSFRIHMYKWPEFLRRMRQIRVKINMYPTYVDPGLEIIRSCLQALVAFLADGHCLEGLEINLASIWCSPPIDLSIDENFTNFVKALTPVLRLPGLDELKLTREGSSNLAIDLHSWGTSVK